MLISVSSVGAAVLVGIALLIGSLEGGSQRDAWRRIASERRELAERRRALDEECSELAEEVRRLRDWERRLSTAADGSCPVCGLGRRRGQGERPAS